MARGKLPLAPLAVFSLLRELRDSATHGKPLVLGGARSLVEALHRELVRDGDATAVREASLGALDGAAALVYVLAGHPTEEDERALRAADVAGTPIVVIGPTPEPRSRSSTRRTSSRSGQAKGSRWASSLGCSARSSTRMRRRWGGDCRCSGRESRTR